MEITTGRNVSFSSWSNAGASVKADEEEFFKVLEGRVKNAEGKLKLVDVGKQVKKDSKALKTTEAIVILSHLKHIRALKLTLLMGHSANDRPRCFVRRARSRSRS